MTTIDINKKILNESDEDIIKNIIFQIRPYINSEGGDIEFIKLENDYVFVKIYGSCLNCMYKDYTIQDNLLATIQEKIPHIKDIIVVDL